MANRNTYVRVFDDIGDHPGFMAVSNEGLGLWLLSLTYCSRNLTDGHFPKRAVNRWEDVAESEAAALLLYAGRWHERGHGCPECPEVAPGFFYVHGYLSVQRSRDEVAELSAKRSRAGAEGGKAKAAKQLAKQESGNGKQEGGKSYPDTDTDTDTDTEQESKPRKRAHTLPDGFTPNDTNRRIAAECGVNLATAVASFKDYHGAKGTTMKDWHLALNTWIRRERPTLPRAVPASPAVLPPPPSGDLFGNFGGAR